MADTAIVICATRSWLAPACVTLLSVARNLGNSKADFYIIVDGLTSEDETEVAAFEAKHGVKFKLVNFSSKDFQHLDAHRYSVATFMRLELNHLLPNTLKRVLYLDSDILALKDLQPLLEVDMKGKPLAAVPEVKLAPRRGVLTDIHRKTIGFTGNEDYFNAGVLLFDWQATLKSGLLQRAADILNSGQKFEFLDQDALNLAFKDQWLALPLKWNVEQTSAFYLGIDAALRHFNHAAKPWDWRGVMGYARYNDYYAQALQGLALERFLSKKKQGSPLLANIEFGWRAISLHQRRFLRKRYAKLL